MRTTLMLLGWVLLGTAFAMADGADVNPGDQAPRAGEKQQELLEQVRNGESLDDATLERLLSIHHTERDQVRMVMVPATVVDRRGRLVRGLDLEDFRLDEDRVEQRIEFFSAETSEPISVAFLLDLSGSMRQLGKLLAAKEAIRYFVDNLRPGDRFALIGFADEQVAHITDFTSDRERFLRRLNVQRAYGQTALYDAVAATPRIIDEEIEGRKAIVLITDGIDNASTMNMFDAMRLARSVNVPIYTLGFTNLPEKLLRRGETVRNLKMMNLFADQTGGHVYSVHDPVDLKEAVAEVEHELRLQYLIGYYPEGRAWDGTFRRIRVTTARNGLTVRARHGYYAHP